MTTNPPGVASSMAPSTRPRATHNHHVMVTASCRSVVEGSSGDASCCDPTAVARPTFQGSVVAHAPFPLGAAVRQLEFLAAQGAGDGGWCAADGQGSRELLVGL